MQLSAAVRYVLRWSRNRPSIHVIRRYTCPCLPLVIELYVVITGLTTFHMTISALAACKCCAAVQEVEQDISSYFLERSLCSYCFDFSVASLCYLCTLTMDTNYLGTANGSQHQNYVRRLLLIALFSVILVNVAQVGPSRTVRTRFS